ncbi:hypothetical protein HDU67_004889 [Dinochytrium kinnereticum]|nr:hypothetical protein HDU67_004889 [Dinochytrium kinnereticum]
MASSSARSREERLKELERERRLFTTRGTGGNTLSSRIIQDQEGLSGSSSRSHQDPHSPLRGGKQAASESLTDADVCFASELGGLKGKIRVNRDGRHSFVDGDEKTTSPTVSKILEKDRAGSRKDMDFTGEWVEKERGRERERERPESKYAKAISSSYSAKKPAEKRSNSADAWKQLVSKETKNRTKFYGTEKTLLVLLEEERSRFTQLEEEYHKLLAEVQALQTSHLQDLRNLDRRSEADLKAVQKALVIKTDECAQIQKELSQYQGRYAKESAGWISANERLESHVGQLDRLLKEMEKRAENQDKAIQELTRSKKELGDMVNGKEGENRKILNLMKEKEAEWVKEKEMRMKLEVQALQLDHFVAQRDEDIKTLRLQLQKKSVEADEVVRVRGQIQEAHQDLDDLTKREKMYLDEIEQLTTRERKLFSDLEDMSNGQKRALAEIDRLTNRESSLIREIDQVKIFESKLHQEIVDARARINQESEEVATLTKQNRNLQLENARLSQEVFEAKSQVQEQKMIVEQRDMEIRGLKESEFMLRRERDDGKVELSTRQSELSDLQKQLQDVAKRLESEVQSKIDIKHQNKEKLIAVAEKISDLQDALGETQQQISELKQNEEKLRTTIRQKEDAMASQQRQTNELQQVIAELQSNLAKESYMNETLKTKKKEELLALQEKFSTAKAAMDQEAQNLRAQLNQKQIQAHVNLDESSRLKIEVSELTADRFRLEARLTELTALESSHSRQISNLQQQLRQRDQELSLLSIKHQTLVEQLKRIDDEIQGLKASSVTLRDGDGARVQMNINDLSRRIKTQLGILLDQSTTPSITASTTFLSGPPPPTPLTRLSKSIPSRTATTDAPLSSQRQSDNVEGRRPDYEARGIAQRQAERDRQDREREYRASSSMQSLAFRRSVTQDNKHIVGFDDLDEGVSGVGMRGAGLGTVKGRDNGVVVGGGVKGDAQEPSSQRISGY